MSIKSLLLALGIFSMSISGVIADEKWLPGPDKNWQIRYEDAMKIAKRDKKNIYVLATGSDWCYWCKKLKSDVLNSNEFKKFAEKHLVLLYIDLPSSRLAMPMEQRNYNYQLSRKLDLDDGVPAALIINADGKVIARQNGYAPLAAYMNFLQKSVNK